MTKAKKSAVAAPVEVDSVVANRTPETIAAEIRFIDGQARQYVMHSAIEIGNKLNEAKALVSHGEWGKWLKDNVDYSQSTANNFMRVADEYAQSPLALSNISYTQAVQLLSVPAEEREQFVTENDVEDMSSRELQAAIKAKQELEQRLKEEQAKAAEAEARAEQEKAAREALHGHYQTELKLRQEQEEQINKLQADLDSTADDKAATKLKDDLKKAKADLAESKKRIKELDEAIKAKPIDVPATVTVEVVPEATQKELEDLRRRELELNDCIQQKEEEARRQIAEMKQLLQENDNKAAIEVQLCFETLVNNFDLLLKSIVKVGNEGERASLRGAIAKLCDQMKASLDA